MNQEPLKIIIAGAGIGGLALAIKLARAGQHVDIFEASPQLSEIGAGLQLSANALHVLSKLGLSAQIKTRGFEPQNASVRHYQSGKALLTAPLKGAHEKRYGQKYLHIHRAALHTILREQAEKSGAVLHLGQSVERYSQTEDGAALITSVGTHQGDVIIGADGIHTAIGAQMHGGADPSFTGQTAWRGLVPASALPDGLIPRDATVWAGPGQHCVTYYVKPPTPDQGQLINFVAVKEQESWSEESWSQQGDMDDLRNAFSGWSAPVTQLLQACETCHLWGLFDREPLTRWTDGHVTIMGDAAHPMLPFMAQGAAMAIEDAYVLGTQILKSDISIEARLKRYEDIRRPRASMLQAISRENAKTFHMSGGFSRAIRAAKFKIGSKVPAARHSQFDRIYGVDVTKL